MCAITTCITAVTCHGSDTDAITITTYAQSIAESSIDNHIIPIPLLTHPDSTPYNTHIITHAAHTQQQSCCHTHPHT